MTLVEPVPFRKARGWAPRLSEPYVPGKPRHERYWSEEENAVLREHYATKGAAYCASLLPKRRARQVYHHAIALGLKRGNQPLVRQPKTLLTAELAATIRERWPELAGRGAVQRLAEELGLKRDTLSKFALQLGLTLPHKKEPPWTASEDDLLSRMLPKSSPAVLVGIFRDHGFVRSESAIRIHAKRLQLSTRWRATLSARQAAAILGIDDKTATELCIEGRLKAERRESKRLPQQGGKPWSIRREDLRQYIIDNIERIDIRKVDRVAFVDVLVSEAPAIAGDVASVSPAPRRCSAFRAIPKLRALGFVVSRRRR